MSWPLYDLVAAGGGASRRRSRLGRRWTHITSEDAKRQKLTGGGGSEIWKHCIASALADFAWQHLRCYCHFTWEPGQQRKSADSRLTPDAVHLIDISMDNDPFSALHWWLHGEASGGGEYKRNVTLVKSARREAPPDECRVSGSSLPSLCPG